VHACVSFTISSSFGFGISDKRSSEHHLSASRQRKKIRAHTNFVAKVEKGPDGKAGMISGRMMGSRLIIMVKEGKRVGAIEW
jgi:hypothetical protein